MKELEAIQKILDSGVKNGAIRCWLEDRARSADFWDCLDLLLNRKNLSASQKEMMETALDTRKVR